MQSVTPLLSIAPMIDWSDTFFRTLMRFLAPQALIYTEMYTAEAVIHNTERTLRHTPIEMPVAVQLGGRDPEKLAAAARIIEEQGFSEVNLNLGCPSSRVLSGQFGAGLMREPKLVAKCITAMKAAVSIPVTAKTRIGVDNKDSYAFFKSFIDMLVDAGADKLIIHARKAWLKGLSPKQNRTIPPVIYDYVYNIKKAYPNIPMVINGDIKNISDIRVHLSEVEGVMLGRLACNEPYQIAILCSQLYNTPLPSRSEILSKYFEHIQLQKPSFNLRHRVLKPILNLTHGLPHTKSFKQKLLSIESLEDEAWMQKLCNRLVEMEEFNSISA